MSEQNINVLLVDDDDIDCQALSRYVREKGLPYRLTIAATYKEALVQLNESNFDLVILDQELGDGTGLDLLPHTGETPTILITGHGSEMIAAQALRHGVCDYLTKDTKRNYLDDLPFVVERILWVQQLRRQKEEAEAALQKAHDELEQQVVERTSALKKAHSQLLHAEKLSAIGRFSASIAHEFNNPLCGVVNVINGVRKRTQLSESDRNLVDLALLECERMNKLVVDLQQFNRPSSERRVKINVEKVFDDILLFTRKELQNRKVKVRKVFSPDLPEIWAVSDQIKQVMINLIGNASDAMADKGGTISIVAAPFANDKITIAIEDTGTGIGAADLEHIFEPFFTTKAIKGNGLGLSVSYGIIKSHDGDIEVESEVGQGTIFTITLPIGMRC